MVTVIGLLCSLVLLVQNDLFNIGHNRRPWCDYLSSNPIVSNTDARTYVPDVHMFNWTSIIPSEKLVWTRCYAKFECARLSVPLDYKNLSDEKAAVAILRFPSKVPPELKSYRGPILFNPGGPGGSGISMVLNRAEAFRIVLGDDYDLVGFDPRGVGFTTPGLLAFPSDAEAALFSAQAGITMNSSTGALGELFGVAKILGEIMEARAGDIVKHMTTPVVARDMLSIIKAYGRDKLQYWGFSYGTVLGATFAAMFPNSIERMIIDGVVDAESYYASVWSNNLRDTDAALNNIYQACIEAGPLICPLYEGSISKITARVDALLEKLRTTPVAFFNENTGTYGSVDYSTAKNAIFSILYRPHTMGQNLTYALVELEEGNAEPLWELSSRKTDLSSLQCDCPSVPPVPFSQGKDVNLAIACSDGEPLHYTITELRKLYDHMAQYSTFAETWWRYIGCSGWKVRPVERFTGSFTANTSFPILLIGNTADPVTPLYNAHKMSKGFSESVVMTQDSPGHCSLSATSLCTTKAVRDYFRHGVLPKEGTSCSVESSIFESLRMDVNTLQPDDITLLSASWDLANNYFVPTT